MSGTDKVTAAAGWDEAGAGVAAVFWTVEIE